MNNCILPSPPKKPQLASSGGVSGQFLPVPTSRGARAFHYFCLEEEALSYREAGAPPAAASGTHFQDNPRARAPGTSTKEDWGQPGHLPLSGGGESDKGA